MADTLDDLFRLTVVPPTGESLNLDAFSPYEIEGFGMAPLVRLREHGPQQDGESDLGYRLKPRLLRFSCTLRGDTPQELYDRRDELLRVFRPTGEPLVLQVHLPGGGERRIDGYLTEGLSFHPGKRRGLTLETEIILNAPDPAFYDPTEKTLAWTWPPTEQETAYEGSWRSFPQVVINGPLENFTLTNLTMEISIGLLYVIAAGEQVQFFTGPGALPPTSTLGINLAGKIAPGSDVSNFFLDPDGSGGINRFIAAGNGGLVGTTQVTMKWHDRFIGI